MSKLPKKTIGKTGFDYAVEGLSILALIFNLVYLIYAWGKLPDRIPTHFNAAGEVDGYGGKSTLFVLMAVTFLIYFGLTALNKVPHLFNYAVVVTEKNAEIQYRYAQRMIRLLKLDVILIFSYLQIASIRAALEGMMELGGWFLPVSLTVTFGTIAVYLYKSIRAAKG